MIDLTIPLRLPSAANLREHWAKKHRRVKAERDAVRMYLGARPRPPFPLVVTLTRIAPRPFDDDNIRGAFKATRDQIAEWLGVPDNDPRVRWEYAQERRGARVYAVAIRVGEGR